MSKTAIYFTVIILILIVLVAAYFVYLNNAMTNTGVTLNSSPGQTATNTVRLGSSASLGNFLTDTNGKTLYYFANDTAGVSNCTSAGQCSTLWPPFYSQAITVPNGLNVSDFSQITNPAGQSQTTYLGWPLYYYSGDSNPGDTNGQGIAGIWFVAESPFYNVLLMNNTKSKIYLADFSGKAIYYFKNGEKCTGTCLSTWTIFDQPQLIVPSTLKQTDFQEFTRADGLTQLEYKNAPLYQYTGDQNSGDTKGDGVGKLWYLVKP